MNKNKKHRVSQISRSFRKFSDYSGDVLRSDMNTFDDRIHFLMSYCKSDSVFSTIHGQLIQGDDAVFEKWLKERKATATGMVGSGDLIFPEDEDTRIRTMYWLLRKVDSGEIDASDFSHDFYATNKNSINVLIQFFTETVVAPLKRDLEYRFEEMMEDLPSNPGETVPLASIQIIHNAQNVIQQNAHGADINQEAKIEVDDEIEGLFNKLLTEISKSISDEEVKHEALSAAKDAKDIALMDSSKKTVVARILSLLPALGNIGSVSAAILTAMSM